MSIKSRRAKLLALFLPFLLLLGACKADNTVKVSESGDMSLMSLIDVSDMGIDNEMYCSMLSSTFEGNSEIAIIGTISTNTVDDGGTKKCQLAIEFSSTVKASLYSDQGDEATVSIPASYWSQMDSSFSAGTQGVDLGNVGFSVTIEAPGQVTDATDGGQIEGNRVTWTDYDQIKNSGIEATYSKSGSSSSSSSPSTSESSDDKSSASESSDDGTTNADADSASSEDDDSGVPAWIWILIAVAALALIGTLAAFVIRRRKNDSGNGGPGGLGG
ncbi:MAG: hypothetical protein Q3979_09730, partial [Actinomycetaceae bacterium]|nr:hypothetical protein [Actinomycetaceae bacterium]